MECLFALMKQWPSFCVGWAKEHEAPGPIVKTGNSFPPAQEKKATWSPMHDETTLSLTMLVRNATMRLFYCLLWSCLKGRVVWMFVSATE